MNEASHKPQAFPWKQMRIPFLIIGITVGLAIWMVFDSIWPASAFIELQSNWFNGEYYPKMTVVITWICVLIGFLLIGITISGILHIFKKRNKS
jgi:hypothetical protein